MSLKISEEKASAAVKYQVVYSVSGVGGGDDLLPVAPVGPYGQYVSVSRLAVSGAAQEHPPVLVDFYGAYSFREALSPEKPSTAAFCPYSAGTPARQGAGKIEIFTAAVKSKAPLQVNNSLLTSKKGSANNRLHVGRGRVCGGNHRESGA
jgi:hypothetical protein